LSRHSRVPRDVAGARGSPFPGLEFDQAIEQPRPAFCLGSAANGPRRGWKPRRPETVARRSADAPPDCGPPCPAPSRQEPAAPRSRDDRARRAAARGGPRAAPPSVTPSPRRGSAGGRRRAARALRDVPVV
jgi:hypothetical protein